jgi:hypothetical protein
MPGVYFPSFFLHVPSNEYKNTYTEYMEEEHN